MNRNHKISVRLNDTQNKRLVRLSSKFCISKSKVIQLLLSIKHTHISDRNLNRLIESNNSVITHLNALYDSNWKIGVNINQIARQMNRGEISFRNERLLSDLVDSIESIKKLIKNEVIYFDNKDHR